MSSDTAQIHRKLTDALYVEAMLLADEARGYFDQMGRDQRDSLDAMARVSFSCESLKVTTRLMHVIAWLLTQRAVAAGELQERDALDPSRRLGASPPGSCRPLRGRCCGKARTASACPDGSCAMPIWPRR